MRLLVQMDRDGAPTGSAERRNWARAGPEDGDEGGLESAGDGVDAILVGVDGKLQG